MSPFEGFSFPLEKCHPRRISFGFSFSLNLAWALCMYCEADRAKWWEFANHLGKSIFPLDLTIVCYIFFFTSQPCFSQATQSHDDASNDTFHSLYKNVKDMKLPFRRSCRV